MADRPCFAPAVARGLALAVAAWSLLSAPADAETMDQLHALARQERNLVVWAGGPAAGHEAATRAFEQRYPGIPVAVTAGFSNVLDRKIEEQLVSRRIEADVVILQTVQDLVRWNNTGHLVQFKPDGFEAVGTRFKQSDGAWVAISTNPIFYGYNTERVRHDAVPALAIDFLRSQFKEHVISAYPSDDDATLFAFTSIIRKYGWGYMSQYMSQKPKFVQGRLAVARSLGSGESVVSFDATPGTILAVQHAGGKVALAGPTDDFLPVFFSAEAILKGAPHPNAAKLYVGWLLSKEWQSQAASYSSRGDVPAPFCRRFQIIDSRTAISSS
jgi:ABC-type Fe3+ transport system substrate-binding protein